jgi:hypothetical protein
MHVDTFEVGDRVILTGEPIRGVVIADDPHDPPRAAEMRGEFTVRVLWADGMDDHYRPDQLRPDPH